jgi:hypothetical protein
MSFMTAPLDLEQLHRQARKHLRGGQPEAAAWRLLELLRQVDAKSALYDVWLDDAAQAFTAAREPLRAALLHAVRGRFAQALTLLPPEHFPRERALVLLASGTSDAAAAATGERRAGGEAGRARPNPRAAEAATLLADSGCPVLAALVLREAGHPSEALRTLLPVLSSPRLTPYPRALVHAQLATLHRDLGEEREARRQAAQAQQLLEEQADEHIAAGVREQALDCYRVLVHLGEALRRFENIVEGEVSCIRLLSEEGRALDALGCYEELLEHAASFGEHAAAAQLAREAVALVRGGGLDPALGRRYWSRAADAAHAAAGQVLGQRAPVALAEHALLGAVEAHAVLGDFTAVRGCFRALAELPLSADAAARYLAKAARYPDAPPAGRERAPIAEPPPRPVTPPVWTLDLVEWETAGDPLATCLLLLFDTRRPSLVRRHALNVALTALGPPSPEGQDDRERELLRGLGGLQCYEAQAPLERIYQTCQTCQTCPPAALPSTGDRPDGGLVAPSPAAPEQDPEARARLRAAVVGTLPKLPFRRALRLLLRALDDPDAGVRSAAETALAQADFPDAVPALCRLFRERSEPVVREAVLHALGGAYDARAVDFLLEVVRTEAAPYAQAARRQLLRQQHPALASRLSHHLALATGPAREQLAALLAR